MSSPSKVKCRRERNIQRGNTKYKENNSVCVYTHPHAHPQPPAERPYKSWHSPTVLDGIPSLLLPDHADDI